MSFDMISRLDDMSDVFLGNADVPGGIAFPEALNRTALDYSLESLHLLDKYLDVLHRRANEIEDETYTNTVVGAGSYLGEVVRRNAQREYRWSNYDNYFATRQNLTKIIPECLGTSAILVVPDTESMTLPLNKIVRYIDEGPDNNTHYYAAVEIKST